MSRECGVTARQVLGHCAATNLRKAEFQLTASKVTSEMLLTNLGRLALTERLFDATRR